MARNLQGDRIMVKLVAAVIAATGIGCQSQVAREPGPQAETARSDAKEASRDWQREAGNVRAKLSKRLEALERDLVKLESKAKKASAKTQASMEKTARELRADARRLRHRMSTWDDKAESTWRSVKREVEEGLEKTERAVKKIFDDETP